MKNIKRILSLFLILTLSFTFFACGSEGGSGKNEGGTFDTLWFEGDGRTYELNNDGTYALMKTGGRFEGYYDLTWDKINGTDMPLGIVKLYPMGFEDFSTLYVIDRYLVSSIEDVYMVDGKIKDGNAAGMKFTGTSTNLEVTEEAVFGIFSDVFPYVVDGDSIINCMDNAFRICIFDGGKEALLHMDNGVYMAEKILSKMLKENVEAPKDKLQEIYDYLPGFVAADKLIKPEDLTIAFDGLSFLPGEKSIYDVLLSGYFTLGSDNTIVNPGETEKVTLNTDYGYVKLEVKNCGNEASIVDARLEDFKVTGISANYSIMSDGAKDDDYTIEIAGIGRDTSFSDACQMFGMPDKHVYSGMDYVLSYNVIVNDNEYSLELRTYKAEIMTVELKSGFVK